MANLAQNLLAILQADTSGALVSALQSFQTSVDATPTPANIVAQGEQFGNTLLTSGIAVEGKLITDTTNLLVGDAISYLQTPPATVPVATTAPAAAPTTAPGTTAG